MCDYSLEFTSFSYYYPLYSLCWENTLVIFYWRSCSYRISFSWNVLCNSWTVYRVSWREEIQRIFWIVIKELIWALFINYLISIQNIIPRASMESLSESFLIEGMPDKSYTSRKEKESIKYSWVHVHFFLFIAHFDIFKNI